MSEAPAPHRFPAGPGAALADLVDALRFFSRLPLPAPPPTRSGFDLARVAWAVPLAGAVIGVVGALALAAARVFALPALLAAALAVAALVAASGALHEDGLADVADGFGGGRDKAKKLEIMRDSRIGAFGALALGLSLILRIAALAAALDRGFWPAAGALVLVAGVARAGALAPLALLAPARADGLGATAGRLSAGALGAPILAAAALALALALAGVGLGPAFRGLVGAAFGALAVCFVANRQIGGQTGDVAGAAEQAAEIAAWCGLLIGAGAP